MIKNAKAVQAGCLSHADLANSGDPMQNKRKWPRIACLERCNVQPTDRDNQMRPARILNYSATGVMLETDIALAVEELVKIHLVDEPDDDLLRGIEKRVGKVCWCSMHADSFSGMFLVGIEIVRGLSEDMGWGFAPL